MCATCIRLRPVYAWELYRLGGCTDLDWPPSILMEPFLDMHLVRYFLRILGSQNFKTFFSSSSKFRENKLERLSMARLNSLKLG